MEAFEAEERVARRLADIRSRRENLGRDVARAYYETTAGLTAESNISETYERHADLSQPETVSFLRQDARPRAANDMEARRIDYLVEALIWDVVESAVREFTDRILTAEAQTVVAVGSESLPFRKARVEIENEPERSRRDAIYRARIGVIGEMNHALMDRVRMEREVAQQLGYRSPLAMWEDASGIKLADIEMRWRDFLAMTEDMYTEAMGWTVRKRLGLNLSDAEPHDAAFLFRGGEFDRYFADDQMLPKSKAFLQEMTVDVSAGGNIRFDIEERPAKSPRSFCATIDVPREIILVLRPTGGLRDWQSFLHELGLALHYGHVDPNEPYEFRTLGDVSLTETYAFLFQYLTLDRGWLKRYLGFQQSNEYLFLAYLQKLYLLRRYAAKLRYEIELHDNGSLDAMPSRYVELMTEATKLRQSKDLYLYDIDQAFYTARYLRAWAFQALLAKHLCHYFDDDWYRNPRTGEFLKRHWAMGQRLRVEEMAKEIGYTDLSKEPLEEEFHRNI